MWFNVVLGPIDFHLHCMDQKKKRIWTTEQKVIKVWNNLRVSK